MSILLNRTAGWHHIATVEMIGDSFALQNLVGSDSTEYRIEPAETSPHGYAWFDVRVDFGVGDRRAAHNAYVLLTALQRAGDDGLLPGYRLVTGHDWLLIGKHLDRVEDAIQPARRHRA